MNQELFAVRRIPLNIIETVITTYEHSDRGAWSASGAPRKASALTPPISLPFDTNFPLLTAGFVNPYMPEFPSTDFGQNTPYLTPLIANRTPGRSFGDSLLDVPVSIFG